MFLFSENQYLVSLVQILLTGAIIETRSQASLLDPPPW